MLVFFGEFGAGRGEDVVDEESGLGGDLEPDVVSHLEAHAADAWRLWVSGGVWRSKRRRGKEREAGQKLGKGKKVVPMKAMLVLGSISIGMA